MKMPTLYIPHGGGPCFFMEWTLGAPDTWDNMARWLEGVANGVPGRPMAVVVVSAHWEAAEFSVTSAPRPPLIFDYYGFPEHTYHLTYPVAGSPELATRVRKLLSDAGITAHDDPTRGFDHGLFIPFKLIYPDADIPMVQLSLKAGLAPGEHLAAGRALQPLREEGVLIVGSGMSYHNMRGFGTSSATRPSDAFDAALADAVCAPAAALRDERLEGWLSLPHARECHPREEHLLPLMVAAGAAGNDRGRRVFGDHVMEVAVSAFQFGGG